MFPIKLLGIAVAAGAGIGIWASGAIKEKLGMGGDNFKKVPSKRTEVVILPDDIDASKGIRIVGHAKKKPEAQD